MLGRGSVGGVGVVILSSPQAASRSRAERANAFDFIVTPPRVTDCPPTWATQVPRAGASRRAQVVVNQRRARGAAIRKPNAVRGPNGPSERLLGRALLVEAVFLEAPVEGLGRELQQLDRAAAVS